MTTAHTIVFRETMVSLAALALLSVPLMASAGTSSTPAPDVQLLKTEWSAEISRNPEAVYGKLKSQSQEVCGSSDLRVAGGLARSMKVKECYEGTLTAAVHRLDNPAVTELHFD